MKVFHESFIEKPHKIIGQTYDGESLMSVATGGVQSKIKDYSNAQYTINGLTRPGSMDFTEHKNPEYDFLRKGSKAVGPVS